MMGIYIYSPKMAFILQAAAYYYHGLILNEGSEGKTQGLAVAALQAAEGFLRESKRACEAFNSAPPISRLP